MSSAHLQIQSAIVAALMAAPALAGGHVKANTVRPLATSQASAVVVRLMSSSAATSMLGAPRDWTTQYQVECLARSASASGDPVAAVDSLIGQAWQRLSALRLAELGVMDVAVVPAIDWQVEDLDTPVAAAVLRLTVLHRTPSLSLETA